MKKTAEFANPGIEGLSVYTVYAPETEEEWDELEEMYQNHDFYELLDGLGIYEIHGMPGGPCKSVEVYWTWDVIIIKEYHYLNV